MDIQESVLRDYSPKRLNLEKIINDELIYTNDYK